MDADPGAVRVTVVAEVAKQEALKAREAGAIDVVARPGGAIDVVAQPHAARLLAPKPDTPSD